VDPLANQILATPAGGGLMSGGPCREKAQTIVSGLVKQHERELAGWNYLQLVMAQTPPNESEEASLHEIFCRARRERY
jgi:hypothetical protein